MSEASPYPSGEEAYAVDDFEFLRRMKFSFVPELHDDSTAPHKLFNSPDRSRLEHFDSYDYRDPLQRTARIIDVAYYALELSTNLEPLDKMLSAVEKIDSTETVYDSDLLDNYITAITVDGVLERAHQVAVGYDASQLSELERNTASYDTQNSGALAALKKMATPNRDQAYISSGVFRQARNILRICIAVEKELKLP